MQPFSTFYVFKGSKMQKNYVKLCKLGTCMGMQKKNLGDNLIFHELMVYFFLQICFRGVFQENRHLLIFDGHGSHVTV